MNSIDWYKKELNALMIQYETKEITILEFSDKYHEIGCIAQELHKDDIESAIIKDCAEESTSAAHNKEVHRQQIIAAYIAAKMERNKVKKHFAYFLKLDRVQIAAQEYFNDTYGDGIPKT
jgi:hypothetical protein